MSSRKKEIMELLATQVAGMSASDVAVQLHIDRANASRYLTELYKEGKVQRSKGRPVIYTVIAVDDQPNQPEASAIVSFANLIGANESLKVAIQQGKAAILYPPRGLHTLIFGQTGTGKSLFAECMHHFAVESGTLPATAPFISFNCADYAQNPQLLFGHIFGVRKGAFTGADEDRPGLVAKADGGILFLDEVHRLPPEGQEMLFTFIDKGTYHPLGESAETFSASVQIIGATTESSETFLTTFSRRIPMMITLPALKDRSLDERYEIISRFIKQEANRLNQRIDVERDVILAFMLYNAEGNIGQVKRDLKLVCAKAFLHYRTHQEDSLTISQKDLPLQVQKGLLKIKEAPERINRFVDHKTSYLSFEPGANDIVWSQDPARNMDVYNTIDEKVERLSQIELDNVDLEALITSDVDVYFENYVKELAQNDIHRELIPDNIWYLTDRLYDIAEQRLKRTYNEQARFTFALHLQSTIERIRDNHSIVHPNLNEVRKHYSKEFQTAIDLSAIIEEEFGIDIPFDEIGFITMFLTIDVGEKVQHREHNVVVLVLMHGRSTASSMLEAVQELLGTDTGVALNMPLTMEVQRMYEQLKEYVLAHKDQMSSGLLLLTDMGSLNTFGNMIYEETGIRTKAVSMVSTMIVLEAVRMASIGRSLEDIYQNIQMSFESIARGQITLPVERKKAVVVTCFTGEGVAARLHDRILPVIDPQQIEIIQMQFLERATFKKHIDELMEEYDIKAITGTVDIEYQNIPFFSAFDIFDDEKLNLFKRVISEEVPLEEMAASLQGTLKNVGSVPKLLAILQKMVHQIQTELHLIVEPGVDAGLIIHIAFLLDTLKQGHEARQYRDLQKFRKRYRVEMDTVKTNLMPLEKQYRLELPEDEIAHITRIFLENSINHPFGEREFD